MKFLSALSLSAIFIFFVSAAAFAEDGKTAELSPEAASISPDLIGKINEAIAYAGADFLGKTDTVYICAANIEGVIVNPAKEFLNEDAKLAKEDLVVVKNKFKQLSVAFSKGLVGDAEETSICNDAIRRKKVAEQMKRISAYAILSVKEAPKAISDSYSPLLQNAALFLAYQKNGFHSENTHDVELLQRLHNLVEESPWLEASLAKPSVLAVEAKPAAEKERSEPTGTGKSRPASTTNSKLKLSDSESLFSMTPIKANIDTSIPFPPVGGPQGGIGKDVLTPIAGIEVAVVGGAK